MCGAVLPHGPALPAELPEGGERAAAAGEAGAGGTQAEAAQVQVAGRAAAEAAGTARRGWGEHGKDGSGPVVGVPGEAAGAEGCRDRCYWVGGTVGAHGRKRGKLSVWRRLCTEVTPEAHTHCSGNRHKFKEI